MQRFRTTGWRRLSICNAVNGTLLKRIYPFATLDHKLLTILESYIISLKADNFIVSLCHWQLRPWLRLITLTRSPKPDSAIECAHYTTSH